MLSRRTLLAGAGLLVAGGPARAAEPLREIRIDYATYNPLSLLIRSRGLLEKAFGPGGTTVRWVSSLGSNKALEFLNAESIDIGSAAAAAALLGRINGNPVQAVGTFSKPEWTALVTTKSSSLKTVADLKGRRVAVTRGTDPHIFLIRALETAGLSQSDIKPVLLQHADGKAALLRGDVEAWAGLDPLMAQAEVEDDARLIYRNPAFNSAGVLLARDAFAKAQPDAVTVVLKTYEEARQWAAANPDAFKQLLAAELKLPLPIVARQLERTDLSAIGLAPAERDNVLGAGKALQQAGLIDAGNDLPASVGALFNGDRLKAG